MRRGRSRNETTSTPLGGGWFLLAECQRKGVSFTLHFNAPTAMWMMMKKAADE